MKMPFYPEAITLRSLQKCNVLASLQHGEIFRTPEELAWPSTEDCDEHRKILVAAYDWMAARLNHKDPRLQGLRWPIWAWRCIADEGPKRPDLRKYREYEEGVLLELRISSRRVLLTDFDGWHDVLNDCPNRYSFDKYDREWDESADDPIRRRQLARLKVKSWDRCMRVNNARATQAVFWELRPEDVTRFWFYRGYPRLKWSSP